ncbi:MAG: ABC transporter ATP-binding protein [Gemmatimonadales bacterium]
MLLEVEGISAGYGKVAVLHGVTLGVDAGECVAILGSNNAGKSTLLRVISGLIPERGGRVRFDDQDITADPSGRRVRRGLVQVPEGRHVFADLTVEENLLLGGLRLRGGQARRAKLTEMYETFAILRGLRLRQAGTLSGGEQQVVVIARGLMAEPRILLLDEPTLGLSPVAVDGVLEVLLGIRTSGTTMVVVEQNVQLCFDLCSRGYVLRQGRVVIADSMEKLTAEELKRAYFA